MNCPFCNRETPLEFQERHHLIPKVKKGKDTVLCCCDCGDMIHQLFNNNELKNKLNTVERIKASPKMQSWISWVSRKPNSFGVTMARKK